MSEKYNVETITVLLKQLIEKVAKIDDHVTSLSKGQGLLGISYNELKDTCQKRWERSLQLEKRKKIQHEMEKSNLFSILFKNKTLIKSIITWLLILGTTMYALISNNSDLIKIILERIHI